MPRFLAINQKQQRSDDSERGLELFQRNPNMFLHHDYISESNRQSAELLEPGESDPKRKNRLERSWSVFFEMHAV